MILRLKNFLKWLKKIKVSSPEPTGLTIGFFKKYFPYFGKHFVDLLNDKDNELCETFNKINIKLRLDNTANIIPSLSKLLKWLDIY